MRKPYQKRNNKRIVLQRSGKTIRVDEGMESIIQHLDMVGLRPVSCCSGHRRYPMTIVCRYGTQGKFIELMQGKMVPRVRRYYAKDKQGFFYIPEVSKI